MSGIWKGTGIVPGSLYSTDYIRTLDVEKVVNNRFIGKLISEVNDGKGTRQDIAFSGLYENRHLNFTYGSILYTKEPPYGQWWDCRACNTTSLILISGDTILLTLTNINCGLTCDGETKYYKLLSGFDVATRQKIIAVFGKPETKKIADISTQKDNLPPVKKIITDSIKNQPGRVNTIIATYKVFSPEIKIMLYDNGEIDKDTVSVYYNGSKIVNRKLISTDAITYTVTASANNRLHEFILVAENLGDIPPNTAFMRIISGSDQYELFAKTNLEENAVIRIEYAGK
ncbi:MAG: hypothetical protein IT249_07485 [Chitinophagaceae bacterium]|nr:hypothetical protein [Chitinophagaceae bacterium]